MPLAPSGSRGYGDYQRVGNFDTGVLWNNQALTTNFDISSPIIDMSRSAYVGGVVICLGNAFILEFDWTADFAGNVPMGNRAMALTPLIPSQMQVRIPNLGPFLSITLRRMLGLSQTVTVDVIGTNRVYPVELIPQKQVLINQQNVAITAGVSQTLYPSDYYAGPMQIGILVDQAGAILNLEVLSAAGTWDAVQEASIPTNVWQTLTWLMPAGAWRFRISPPGVSGHYILSATPSLTGAT